MPLVDIWKATPDQIESKTVQQLLGFAGDGRLRDGNDTSREFRSFLSHISPDLLAAFASQCLFDAFPHSGLALQDIINQIGRRLGFKVKEGRYRGGPGAVGFDGLWATDDRTILVEVKTTDAYRLSLDTTAEYRRKLVQSQGLAEETSSILYVVGRSDTGDLEAQVRGSRHAWDIRIISVDALLRLLKIKVELEDPTTLGRIRDILIPHEFTRVDGIIDLVFTAAKDIKKEEEVEPESDDVGPTPGKKFTPVNFREACIARLQLHLRESLVKQSFALFANPDGNLGVLCAISKEHARHGRVGYWFAFHPGQKEALATYPKALVSFGCGSEKQILVFPFERFVEWLPLLNKTEAEDRWYWHVHLFRDGKKFSLYTKSEFDNVDVTKYLIAN
jgi:hypothetical protein